MLKEPANPTTRRTLVRVAILAVILGILTLVALGWASRWRPDRAEFPLQGALLTDKNGTIHWGRLKAAGADFADMMHLISGRHSDVFVSFEDRLEQIAGPDSPMAIERPA